MYKNFNLYNNLNLNALFISKVPILVSEYNTYDKSKLLNIINELICLYGYKYSTIIYDLHDYGTDCDYKNDVNIKTFTGFFPDNKFVKKGIFVSNISSGNNIYSSYTKDKYVHKVVITKKLLMCILDNKLTQPLFNQLFFLHIKKDLIIYPHMDDFGLGIIDLSGKNYKTVKNIVNIFLKNGAKIFVNEKGGEYIKRHNIMLS